MKIRTGFVSNSSTTSFLISSDDNIPDVVPLDIKDMGFRILRNVDDFNADMLEEGGFDSVEEMEEYYEKHTAEGNDEFGYRTMKKLIDAGKQVAVLHYTQLEVDMPYYIAGGFGGKVEAARVTG